MMTSLLAMRPLIVPKVPYIPPIPTQTVRSNPEPSTSGESSVTSAKAQDSRKSGVYYPSQDPQHLGAKDLAD